MADSNGKTKEYLKHNYDIFFREVLTNFLVQVKCYDNDLNIGKNKWYRLCEGNAKPSIWKISDENNNTVTFTDALCERTGIDIKILKGEKKMRLYANKDMLEENEQDIRIEIENLVKEIRKNERILSNEKEMEKYNSEFIKLIKYAKYLKENGDEDPEEVSKRKINNILSNLKDITRKDYEQINDSELLNGYIDILEKHIKVIRAIETIKNFQMQK